MTRTCIVSALRVSVLSTMDFTDITYSIPRANIFSGLEPCIAIILACIPMMRPLLGRSADTTKGSGRTPVKPMSKPRDQIEMDDNGFERLNDDMS